MAKKKDANELAKFIVDLATGKEKGGASKNATSAHKVATKADKAESGKPTSTSTAAKQLKK